MNLSRRVFLSGIPAAAFVAPSALKALPEPMPVVEYGYIPRPGTVAPIDSPHVMQRIWAHWRIEREKILLKSSVRASEMKARMEDAVEAATGHRPPLMIYSSQHHEMAFIFHAVQKKIPNLNGPVSMQPCYKVEWLRTFYEKAIGPIPDHGNFSLIDHMPSFSFYGGHNILYDL